ncbi:fructosamine kinase family protein [Bifidobacterium psychraerophilum]
MKVMGGYWHRDAQRRDMTSSNWEDDMEQYRKSRAHSPRGFFECEGRGLKWLAEAQPQGGPRVVEVFGWGNDYLDIERVQSASPTPRAAHDFGAALAHLHDFGAEYFGEAPKGYDGTCYFGPLQDPVPMDTGTWTDAAQYYGEGRLLPMVQMGLDRGSLNRKDMEMTQAVVEALPELLGPAASDRPARLHGDLWSGNVMWTADRGHAEAVLIDPAAHGGHREEDLAMLHLFGMSYLHDIIDGYQSVHPLASAFMDRMTLWQLYPIAGHCVFFGGGYVSEYRSMCRSLLG